MTPTLAPTAPPRLAPPPAADGRAAEDRFLRATFRAHARTFGLAARLLPRSVRLPVATLYLYCRTVDEIGDDLPHRAGLDAARRALDDARQALEATLAGRPPGHALLWRRLAEVCEVYALPPGPLRELLDGVGWDLEGRPIRDEADLLAYADLVAGSVGAMMLPVLEPDAARRPPLVAPARALGRAMQITNILRDVGEDRRLGRVYLPAALLDAHGLAAADLDGPILNGHQSAYATLCERLMALAEHLYADAERGIGALPPASRASIRAAARMYREIHNEVRRARYDNLTRRAVVPLHRKALAVVGGYDGRRVRLAKA